MPRFLLGVNYWPRHSAMYMWERFDLGEIGEDAARIKALGLDVVRFFLMWEAFQPEPNAMNAQSLRRLDAMMERIADAGLYAMPTLFCGHMSGVNWLPGWTLDRSTSHGRFRTITLDKPQEYGIGDFYADPQLLRAQVFFARRVGERLRDHPALYAWDIGNEFSNVREPSAPRDAADWSTRLTEALIESSGVGATGGLHGEDLEEDRNIRPSSIAARWKMATIHGYSCYCSFSTDRQDTNVVPFLMELAQSFSGKPVLVSELGNPQCPPGRDSIGSVACLSEDEMVRYAYGVIDRLQRRGALGAMWWCWADYDRALAMLPPFDLAPHELTFGIVRSDGSFKPVAETLARFAREGRAIEETPAPPIAAERDHYAGLPQSVGSEYRAYREAYA